uniref:Putative bifunctional inhibitor/lipid-transfer protein/seed storage 2S albumin superfamily protein n=1 Tax=Helianthus annuus TaxID=4232 RepID=A0A251T8I6_HELAN
MENSLRSCFTVAFMVLLLSAGQLQKTEAQSRCDSVQLSWCLQSIVSNIPPSQDCCRRLRDCCRRLRGQQACLCRETRDPTFGGYLRHPGARRVATACGVTFPRCD